MVVWGLNWGFCESETPFLSLISSHCSETWFWHITQAELCISTVLSCVPNPGMENVIYHSKLSFNGKVNKTLSWKSCLCLYLITNNVLNYSLQAMKNLLEQFNPSKTIILSWNYLTDFEYLFFISLSHFLFLWLNIYCINNTSKSYCNVLFLFRVYIMFYV